MDSVATINYVASDGTKIVLEVEAGSSVMQAAINNGVDGIVGECGGSAMCATCHCYVDEADAEKFAGISPPEEEMLECTSSERKPTSRLGCQLIVQEGMSITVYLPETQQ